MVGSIIKELRLEGACTCLILCFPCLRSQASLEKSHSYLKCADEVPLYASVSPASLQCFHCSLKGSRLQNTLSGFYVFSVSNITPFYIQLCSIRITYLIFFFFFSFFPFGHQVNHYPSLVCSSHLLARELNPFLLTMKCFFF